MLRSGSNLCSMTLFDLKSTCFKMQRILNISVRSKQNSWAWHMDLLSCCFGTWDETQDLIHVMQVAYHTLSMIWNIVIFQCICVWCVGVGMPLLHHNWEIRAQLSCSIMYFASVCSSMSVYVGTHRGHVQVRRHILLACFLPLPYGCMDWIQVARLGGKHRYQPSHPRRQLWTLALTFCLAWGRVSPVVCVTLSYSRLQASRQFSCLLLQGSYRNIGVTGVWHPKKAFEDIPGVQIQGCYSKCLSLLNHLPCPWLMSLWCYETQWWRLSTDLYWNNMALFRRYCDPLH